MTFSKRAIAIVVGVAIFGSLVGPITRTTHAQFAVVETNPALTVKQTFFQGSALTQMIQEYAEKFLLENLRKRLLDMLVDQIIQWIQGGGKPQFVTDWRGFLSDAANVAAGDFIEEIGAGFLCDPFNLQVQVSLLPVPRFSERVTCTLDDVVSNIENFYSDFESGGWIAYRASLEPQNNIYGATLLAWDERDKRTAAAIAAVENEAIAGGGFLSTKSCQEIAGGTGPDLDRDGTPGDVAVTCTVTLPGANIKDLTSKTLGVDIDYILSAEEMDAYVTAIANALINRVIISGVEGIRGLSTGNAPQGGVTPPGGGACAGLSGAALASCLNYQSGTGNSFALAKSTLTIRINDAFPPRRVAQSHYNDSLQRLTQYQADLQNLLSLFRGLPTNIIIGKPCTNFDAYVSAINAELQFASSTAISISNSRALNQTSLDELTRALTNIQNLADGDWTGFSALSSQIQNSGAVDLSAAVAERDRANQENDDLTTRIAQKLQLFNQNLQSCQVGI